MARLVVARLVSIMEGAYYHGTNGGREEGGDARDVEVPMDNEQKCVDEDV